MIERVLDASVVAKWFRRAGEADLASAHELRRRFEAGQLLIVVPPLLPVEVLNAAARRWHWDAASLAALAEHLARLAIEIRQPELSRVARWASLGLTAYDASYVALAEERGTVVVTADQRMLAVGGAFARSLAGEQGQPI